MKSRALQCGDPSRSRRFAIAHQTRSIERCGSPEIGRLAHAPEMRKERNNKKIEYLNLEFTCVQTIAIEKQSNNSFSLRSNGTLSLCPPPRVRTRAANESGVYFYLHCATAAVEGCATRSRNRTITAIRSRLLLLQWMIIIRGEVCFDYLRC